MKTLGIGLVLYGVWGCQVEDSATKMEVSPSAQNRNTNSSNVTQRQTPFTEVEDTDELPVAYREILDKYAHDPADIIKLLDQNQDEAFTHVSDLLLEHAEHIRNELNNMKGVSKNEEGNWEIEYPNNEEGRARGERFRELGKQLDTVAEDYKKLTKLIKNDLRERIAESKRQNRELAEQLKQLKKDLREEKRKVREFRKRQNELIMNLAESIRGWSKSFGEAVDNHKDGLDQIGCTIDNCNIDVEKTEQATQAQKKLNKLLDILTAVTSAEVNNGLQGIEVNGLTVLNFAKGLRESNSTFKLDISQLSSDSEVTLFIGDNKLPIPLPTNEIYIELDTTNETMVARDKSNNTLATGTLSLPTPADTTVGMEVRSIRIEEFRVGSS